MATPLRAGSTPRLPPPPTPAPARPPRRPLRDNPRILLVGIGLLIVVLATLITLATRTNRFRPDFLTEVVLYALSVADLTMLVALVFVLARNIIKLIVERRRALPFARFRAKLVAVLLGLTLIPSLLVLLVGSELIRNSTDRWFNAPMDEILSSANRIASDYYAERQRFVIEQAGRIARGLSTVDLASVEISRLQDRLAPEVSQNRVKLVEVFRVLPERRSPVEVAPVLEVSSPTLPRGASRASAERLASRVASGASETWVLEPLGAGGELLRGAAVIRGASGQPSGVVVATDYLAGDLATRSRRMTAAYEDYRQLRVLKAPLFGVYLSFFFMVTLLILVGATWMGLYLAKRITRPVQLLAVAAREIGAGHLDHRVERETADEFGALVEAFNRMAEELTVGRRKLERSTLDLERKHLEGEGRRRYIETILERIGTGVISVDAAGNISTVNAAAGRLLGVGPAVVGRPATDVFGRDDLAPLAIVLKTASSGGETSAQEIALAREGRELHLAAMATTLLGEGGRAEGTVLVFDDVTPLIRSQKVAAWREVARRLAHEIKNPLTPIQLSAERLKRHFTSAAEPTRGFVDECTTAIVNEVESLKNLVDEFSQFARMPAPRAVPTRLHELLDETLALYDGLFADVRFERHYAAAVPLVRVDPEQLRRVIINLVDNAIEAMERRGAITLETAHDPANSVVRLTVADNGPGIPPTDREKLFLPYYSTKRRGSGLGLAIVRRIIAEHGGAIEVGDNTPRGTRFTIELPA
jgi:two-component system, NtrC family, nitrogen regulation sensor histidine kinase NtrY